MAFALYALALWLQSLACLILGHDAPSGRCVRCGLPVKGERDERLP